DGSLRRGLYVGLARILRCRRCAALVAGTHRAYLGNDDGIAESSAVRRRPDSRGALSALAAQEYLSSALPHANVVSFTPLASARPGRAPSRRNARRVLCRLLLDADGAVVRGRRDESDLDCRARHSSADRE